MQRWKSVAKATAVVMIIGLVNKALGFIREVAIASAYGVGANSDAYYIAHTVPVALFTAFSTALSTTFIPLYIERREHNGVESAVRYANNILNILLLLSSILCLVSIILSPYMLRLIAPGFTGDSLQLAVNMSRIMLPMIIAQTVTGVFTGYLQANQRFIAPALIGFIMNAFIIASTFFAGRYGIYALAVGTLLGVGSQVLVLIPSVMKSGYRWESLLDYGDEYLRKMLALVGPVLVGTAVLQLSELVTKAFASGLPDGSVAALNYATRLQAFAYGTITTPLATVIYPLLARQSASGDRQELKETIFSAMNLVLLLLLPATVALMVLRIPIVTVLFRRGAFDDQAVRVTAAALLYLAAGMTALGIRDIINRTFYALQDTKTPVVNSTLTVGLNIAGAAVFVRLWGLNGLAMASSLAALAGGAVFVLSLRRKLGTIGGKRMAVCLAKVAAAAAVMGGVLAWLSGRLGPVWTSGGRMEQVAALGLCVAVGLAVYGVMVVALRVEEVRKVLGMVGRRRARGTAAAG